MNTFDFLGHLRTLDIQVSVDDGKLRINAPKGAVTAEIKSELAARKAEILAILTQLDTIQVESLGTSHRRPLSFTQEHLWQLQRLTPGTTAYNMHAVFRLSGALNLPAFETAVRAVIDRHQILRAFYPETARGVPEQCFLPSSSVVLRCMTLPEAKPFKHDLQHIIDDAIKAPFDLSTGPLFRPALVRISPIDHVLILAMHHILSDGHSFDVLYEDLACAYRAACTGEPAGWPSLPYQYGDYAAWQRKWLASKASEADRNYWLGQLSGEVPALQLPFDHPHPLHPQADGDIVEMPVPPQLSAALTDLCRREGVTLFTVILTALNILLHRRSGQRDLLLCTPVAARDRAEFSRLVGYFNNTLLLRTVLDGANTMRELLQQVQAVVTNALAHQTFPFKAVADFPNLARTPLSRAVIAVKNTPGNSFQLPGVAIEPVSVFGHAVQYDLSLEVTVSPQQMTARMMYRKVLFERETVEQLARELLAVLAEMLSDLDSPIGAEAPGQPAKRPDGRALARPLFTAPRSDLERRLAQIWQEVLGIDRVGIDDEFFELGGHSLLALRLFTRIEQETGTNLPLSTLFESTTIARLAQLIEGKTPNVSFGCLVPIQPLGSKPVFFCVHGIGGGVLGYRDLVNALGEDQPFIGLQAVGQDGKVEYDLTIEAMASRYIQAMRSYQPAGPYRIGGYCFGGVVAYEMACQLQRVGEEVSFLAVFEGAMPGAKDVRVPLATRLGVFWKSLPTWAQDYSSLTPGQLLSRARSTLTKVWAKFQRNPTIQRRVRVEETLDIDISNLPRANIELTDLHLKAALVYTPGEYRGRVTLFRARNRSLNEVVFGSLDPKMGWDQFAKGGVTVRLVDGFHRNMHLSPYAASLAAELKNSLDSLPG